MVPHRQTRPEERVKPRSHCHLSTTPHTRAPAPACLPPRHKRIRGPVARCAPVAMIPHPGLPPQPVLQRLSDTTKTFYPALRCAEGLSDGESRSGVPEPGPLAQPQPRRLSSRVPLTIVVTSWPVACCPLQR